jgi:hypothetical protein
MWYFSGQGDATGLEAVEAVWRHVSGRTEVEPMVRNVAKSVVPAFRPAGGQARFSYLCVHHAVPVWQCAYKQYYLRRNQSLL